VPFHSLHAAVGVSFVFMLSRKLAKKFKRKFPPARSRPQSNCKSTPLVSTDELFEYVTSTAPIAPFVGSRKIWLHAAVNGA